MKKMVLGLMGVAGLLGTNTVVANAADTDTNTSTGDVTFSSGALSLSVVDNTHLSFGESMISADGADLKVSTTPTVKVSDLRGKNAGWSLTVAQGQQFHTGTGSELTNAALKVAASTVSSDSTVTTKTADLTPVTTTTSGTTTNGAAGTVASASVGGGNGISTFTFSGSNLTVPGATPKLAQGYTTTLTWNLVDKPSN